MSYETEAEMKARWDREAKAQEAKARRAWETTYKKLKPKEKSRDSQRKATFYDFEDWVKESDDKVQVKTTRFTLNDDGSIYMWSGISKSQRFLVVNGPLAGRRITDDSEDYVLYNCAGFNRGAYRNSSPPRCVLVHRASFKTK